MDITESFLRSALDSLKLEILSSLHAAMPGILLDYDPSSGLASVQPGLLRKTASGSLLTVPVLSGVPVLLPSPDFVPSAGAPCLLVFSDFCLDGWLSSAQPVLPPSPRQHDLSDAVALVGFMPSVPSSGSSSEVNS